MGRPRFMLIRIVPSEAVLSSGDSIPTLLNKCLKERALRGKCESLNLISQSPMPTEVPFQSSVVCISTSGSTQSKDGRWLLLKNLKVLRLHGADSSPCT